MPLSPPNSPVSDGCHVAPPSVVRKIVSRGSEFIQPTAWELISPCPASAKASDGLVGETATASMGGGCPKANGSPLVSPLQLPPPSVVRNKPPSVPTYSVLGFDSATPT